MQQHGITRSERITSVYDIRALKRAKMGLHYDKYGERRVIPANSNTTTSFAIRYKNMQPAMVPLSEYDGTRRTGNKIVREEIPYDVNFYGDFVEYTDRDVLLNLRSRVATDYANIIGDQASLTVDTVHRDVLGASTNVTFADGATTKEEVADGNKRFSEEDFIRMGIKLTNQLGAKFFPAMLASDKVNTRGLRASYLGLVHTSVAEDILRLPSATCVTDYSNQEGVMADEVCSIKKFRIREIPNIKVEEVNGQNVYTSLFFAKDAYATTTISKKGGIQTIIKDIDSEDKYDALNEFGLVGWKAVAGAVITNDAWLINGISTASIEDNAELHFMDLS